MRIPKFAQKSNIFLKKVLNAEARDAKVTAEEAFFSPKGIRNSAQGCGATLGMAHPKCPNSERVESGQCVVASQRGMLAI